MPMGMYHLFKMIIFSMARFMTFNFTIHRQQIDMLAISLVYTVVKAMQSMAYEFSSGTPFV